MSWLEKRAMEAAQSLADMTGKRVDEETSDVAEAIEAVAREFAERALRASGRVCPDISAARKGCWVAEFGRSQFGLPGIIEAKLKLDEWAREFIAAAEREE